MTNELTRYESWFYVCDDESGGPVIEEAADSVRKNLRRLDPDTLPAGKMFCIETIVSLRELSEVFDDAPVTPNAQ